MSIQEASTPSSTTGSTANSPAASHPPITPLTPNTSFMSLPTPVESETNSPSIATAPAPNATSPTTAAPPKRKPSRRANTAERRATHNAVERQRRETLNGRFLDLAALLPNLATVRRPSKSAIVNSSIALVHSHRRQRLVAARELRQLKHETELLRRELNEWRDRAALPRIDEPVRTPELLALLSVGDAGTGGDGGEWWRAEGLGEMGEEERRAYELVMRSNQEDDGEDAIIEDVEDEYGIRGGQRMGKPGAVGAVSLQHILPRNMNAQQQQQHHQQQQQQQHMHRAAMQQHRGMPNVASPTSLGFDAGHMPSHPALQAGVNTMYEPNGHPHGHSHALPVHPNFGASGSGSGSMNGGAGAGMGMHLSSADVHAADKLAAAWGHGAHQLYSGLPSSTQGVAPPQWAHQLGPSQSQQSQGQHSPQATVGLFTPPGTAGSAGPPSPLPLSGFPSAQGHSNGQNPPFFAQHPQQHQHHPHHPQQLSVGALGHGHVYASPEMDDASSVGSADGVAVRSAGGSPQPQSQMGSGAYDMGVGAEFDRRPSLSLNLSVPPVGAHWATPGQPTPISSGGGGGGRHLNALMGIML